MEYRITFPGYMERCCGFTIPEGGEFFAFYFEVLARFDVRRGLGVEIDGEWSFNEEQQTVDIAGQVRPFVGVWGGRPLLIRENLGQLSSEDGRVQLVTPAGEVKKWQFENFSGDWEKVTFDATSASFLYGAPYDFDFRYVELG